MKGTFKPGDKLTIEKIPLKQVRKGDAIIFRIAKKDEDDFVVHRVMEISQGGLTTRGDNTLYYDEELVTEENIIGRVTQYERNGKVYKVWNGWRGMLRIGWLHSRLHIIRVVKFFLRKPYFKIKTSGIVLQIWRPKIEMIHFETKDGPLIKYVHRGRTVAMCWIKKNRWLCRRPYDLIIGPKSKSK